MTNKPDKQNWDKWEEYEKLKMSMLKNIYLSQRVMSTFMIELWAKHYNKPYKDAVSRYDELYRHVKAQFSDHLFAEHGSIDLKDILPEDPPSSKEEK